MVNDGEKAPDFCLPDQDGEMVCSRDLAGSYTVLYFYPKDNTKGCSAEAKDFTAAKEDFLAYGAKIVGISPDSVTSHRKFIDSKELDIRLLSDHDHVVAEKYGVWQLKKMYGREYYGIVRSTFLLDPDRNILRSWDKVRVSGHAGAVLDTLRGILD